MAQWRVMLSMPLVFAAGCSLWNGGTMPPLEVVPFVDVGRYMGVWYEIGRYPNWFQKDCVATTATYTLRPDGNITVLNRCRKKTINGEEKSITGKAWSADKKTNAKLKVRFFWPFSGHYWVIQLDPEYRYAVVGHPKRTYLWILSRTPVMDEETYGRITAKLVEQGYDPDRIIRTLQAP
jgi:apolipoprotein D and lipocalin family protein